MAGWHHWLYGHESEWTPGVGDGQGGLACCNSWGHKESDTTERLNWTECMLSQVRVVSRLSVLCIGVGSCCSHYKIQNTIMRSLKLERVQSWEMPISHFASLMLTSITPKAEERTFQTSNLFLRSHSIFRSHLIWEILAKNIIFGYRTRSWAYLYFLFL